MKLIPVCIAVEARTPPVLGVSTVDDKNKHEDKTVKSIRDPKLVSCKWTSEHEISTSWPSLITRYRENVWFVNLCAHFFGGGEAFFGANENNTERMDF